VSVAPSRSARFTLNVPPEVKVVMASPDTAAVFVVPPVMPVASPA
jgi:hypothetical protein